MKTFEIFWRERLRIFNKFWIHVVHVFDRNASACSVVLKHVSMNFIFYISSAIYFWHININYFNSIATTGSTPVRDWIFEYVDNITAHVVPKNISFDIIYSWNTHTEHVGCHNMHWPTYITTWQSYMNMWSSYIIIYDKSWSSEADRRLLELPIRMRRVRCW